MITLYVDYFNKDGGCRLESSHHLKSDFKKPCECDASRD